MEQGDIEFGWIRRHKKKAEDGVLKTKDVAGQAGEEAKNSGDKAKDVVEK